jgi:ribosomal protein L37AE/L43A
MAPAPNYKRNAYSDAINKVRSEHSGTIKHANVTVECPRCATRQVITDAPGMRVCVKCGFEFSPIKR